MDYLAGGETVDFADIQNDIYYLLDKGSYVVDEIGSGTDNKSNGYDFDFVNDIDRLALTVGGEVLDKTELIDPSFNDPYITSAYGFGLSTTRQTRTNQPYYFVLKYYASARTVRPTSALCGDNVPVSNFAPVQLTHREVDESCDCRGDLRPVRCGRQQELRRPLHQQQRDPVPGGQQQPARPAGELPQANRVLHHSDQPP